MRQSRHIGYLSEVMGGYDGVILDLWGVVHDGVALFPDVPDTLAALRKLGHGICLLSNAPRRASTVTARLAEMGLPPDAYDAIVTSGEATYRAMQEKYVPEWGARCYHIGGARDSSLYEGTEIEIVPEPADADFALCSGVRDFSETLDDYRAELEACHAAGLPMICANPDRVVHVGEQLVICAGSMAEAYEGMGNKVVWFGKPYKDVYSLCRAATGGGNMLAVGDGMMTDIAGATGAGIDSILITSGIHRDVFETGTAEDAFAAYPYRPTYTMERLRWG